MKIGVSGHQARVGLDWEWATHAMRVLISEQDHPIEGYSSLAIGTDQIFAKEILAIGGRLHAILPMPDYQKFFEAAEVGNYANLLAQSAVTTLLTQGTDEECFLEAGKYIANSVDLMIALWDGKPSKGLGGTADVINYASQLSIPIFHLNPTDLSVTRLQ